MVYRVDPQPKQTDRTYLREDYRKSRMRSDKVQLIERVFTGLVGLESFVEPENAVINWDGDANEGILETTSIIKARVSKKAWRVSP